MNGQLNRQGISGTLGYTQAHPGLTAYQSIAHVRKSGEGQMPKRVKPPQSEKVEQSVLDNESRIIQKYKDRINSPITAIRSHCCECVGGAVRSIESCPATDCSLHSFRMGVNVFDARHKKAQGKK